MDDDPTVVLLVDGDRERVDGLAESLGAAGYRVVTEHRGTHVVAATFQAQPRLVILVDLLNPNVDGPRIIAGLRLNHYRGKILALSEKKRLKRVDLFSIAEMMGADQAQTRPSTPADLIDVVREILDGDSPPPAQLQ